MRMMSQSKDENCEDGGNGDPTASLKELAELQAAASPEEQQMWVNRSGNVGFPFSRWVVGGARLAVTSFHLAHGIAHVARREVMKGIQAAWWSSHMLPTIEKMLESCKICAEQNIRKSYNAPIGHIPVPDGPFRHIVT